MTLDIENYYEKEKRREREEDERNISYFINELTPADRSRIIYRYEKKLERDRTHAQAKAEYTIAKRLTCYALAIASALIYQYFDLWEITTLVIGIGGFAIFIGAIYLLFCLSEEAATKDYDSDSDFLDLCNRHIYITHIVIGIFIAIIFNFPNYMR